MDEGGRIGRIIEVNIPATLGLPMVDSNPRFDFCMAEFLEIIDRNIR